MRNGPLAGLRVVEMTDDTGRFAGKILAESGASVVQVGTPFPGPPMTGAAATGGLLDWWYDGGKHRVPIDLSTPEGHRDYRRLATSADLVIESAPPGRLQELALDHADLVGDSPSLVQVSLTPFGRTGPRAGWRTSDLVAGAMSGVLSVNGTAEKAIGIWGRQNLNVASLFACISGLAGVYAARETGRGQHVDVSVHEAMTASVEHTFFQWWFPDLLDLPRRALRQSSMHWLGAYVVTRAKTGYCGIAPAPHPGPLFAWMAEEGDPEGAELAKLSIEEALAATPRVLHALKRFALTMDAGELFLEAQRRHIAFGEVQSVAQVAANPQYEYRGLYRAVEGFEQVRLPGPFARFTATPAPAPQPPPSPSSPSSLDAILAEWAAVEPAGPTPAERRHRGPASAGKPLEGIRIVDFTWVLAGPHATRILGDLGADVLKLQSEDRATFVNRPDFPYFYVWNRSKRLVSLNMKHADARDVIRRLVEQADVLMENFSAGVLDRWGLDYATVRSWNPDIVYVTMSGPGHAGPWSTMITYASTIHALSGLTYLSNPPDRRDVGPGFSLNDHVAGMMGAVAVLAALDARRRTGEGQLVDIAQLETGTYLIGPALLDYFANGREAQPVGNADPFGQWGPNEVYRCGDQREVAVTCRDDAEWIALCQTVGWDIAHLAGEPELATTEGRIARRDEIDATMRVWCEGRTAEAVVAALQGNGVPAGMVQDAGDLMGDPQLAARGFFRETTHPLFGERPYDRHPAIWSGTDLEPYVRSGAYIGEHNFEVYRELLGLSDDEIALRIADGLFT